MKRFIAGIMLGIVLPGGSVWAWDHTVRDQLRRQNEILEQQRLDQRVNEIQRELGWLPCK